MDPLHLAHPGPHVLRMVPLVRAVRSPAAKQLAHRVYQSCIPLQSSGTWSGERHSGHVRRLFAAFPRHPHTGRGGELVPGGWSGRHPHSRTMEHGDAGHPAVKDRMGTASDSGSWVVVFVAGARARVEEALKEARELYPHHHFALVTEPECRPWLSQDALTRVFLVPQP